jgi:integrase
VGWVRKRGDSWQAGYSAADGRQHTVTFAKKADAQRWVNDLESRKARGEWTNPALGRQRFGEIARLWRETAVFRETTGERVDSVLKNHVLPYFGSMPIGAVRPSQVQGWVKDRSQTMSPSALEVAYRYLGAIFRMAVKDGMIHRSPCVDIKLPEVIRSRVKPPTTEEVLAIHDAMPARCKALVMVGAGTGLRQGEAFGITVPHLHMLHRTLVVEQQLITRSRAYASLQPPKTEASRREIPLPDVVLEALARHLEEFPPTLELVGHLSGQPELLVFTSPRSGPLYRNRFNDVWHGACRQAGGLGYTFHDLRHYYASLLIRQGESVKVVQSRLGHASAQETLDTYSHLWPDSEDLTRRAVDAVLGRALRRDIEEKAPDAGRPNKR